MRPTRRSLATPSRGRNAALCSRPAQSALCTSSGALDGYARSLARKPAGATILKLSLVYVRPRAGHLMSLSYLSVPVTRRWVRVLFALLVGASAIAACTVDRADMASSACTGLSCRDGLSSSAAPIVGGSAAARTPPRVPCLRLLKVVCGAGSCVPDDALSCAATSPLFAGRAGSDERRRDLAVARRGPRRRIERWGTRADVDGSFSRPTPPESAPQRLCLPAALTRPRIDPAALQPWSARARPPGSQGR
jgi:hypothetical protein